MDYELVTIGLISGDVHIIFRRIDQIREKSTLTIIPFDWLGQVGNNVGDKIGNNLSSLNLR